MVETADLVAEKRTGKQVLNLKTAERAVVCTGITGDHVAVLGENRRFLVFPLSQLPVLGRGSGVALLKGPLLDARTFDGKAGLVWHDGAKPRPVADLQTYLGKRGDAGKAAPPWVPRR